jgi:hypothetical protein
MSDRYRNGVEFVRPYDTDAADLEADGKDIRNPWDPEKHPHHWRYIQDIIDRVDRENIRPPKYGMETKLEVYRLRDQGLTLRQIADTVGVSKSTACLYIQKYKKQQAEAARKVVVTQPGTNNHVESEYRLNEVNVGKIKSKSSKEIKS